VSDRDALLAMIATGVDRLAALAIALWLPRHLGLADYGEYTLVVALLAVFQSLPDGSLESVLVAQLAREGVASRQLAGAAIPVRVAVSGVCGLAGLVALGLASGQARLVLAAAPWALGLWIAAANPYRVLLRAELRFGRYLALIASQAGAMIAALAVVLALGGGLRGVLGTGIVAASAGLLAGWWLAGGGIRARYDRSVARALLRGAVALAATGALLVGAQQFLALVLLRLHGAEAVGLYGGAQRLVDAVNLVPQAMTVRVLPLLARRGRAAEVTAAAAARQLAILVVPLASILMLWPAEVLAIVLGSAFAAAAPILRALGLVALLGASGQVVTALLVATERERHLFATTAVSAGIIVLLGVLLVPAFGAQGLALAMASGMMSGQIGLAMLPTTRASFVPVVRASGRALAAGILAAALALVAAGPRGTPVWWVFASAYLAVAVGGGGGARRLWRRAGTR